MKALSRDLILKRDDLPREIVSCPEWGGKVTVRALTLAERNRLTEGDEKTVSVRAVIAGAIDAENGAALFVDADLEALSAKNAQVIERLARAILRLSGVNIDEASAEKN